MDASLNAEGGIHFVFTWILLLLYSSMYSAILHDANTSHTGCPVWGTYRTKMSPKKISLPQENGRPFRLYG